MAHCITVSEDVEYRDVLVRLLEIRADTREEREALRAAARRKGWSDWVVGEHPLSDGRWGAVLEKGMPEQPDVSGLLAMAELEDAGVSLSWGAAGFAGLSPGVPPVLLEAVGDEPLEECAEMPHAPFDANANARG